MLTQDLLVVMRTVLTAPVAVEDAAFGWRSESDGHFQGPDRQVPLHAIADSPTNDTPGMQIEDHCQIQPTLAGPDVADIARPFLVRLICFKVAIPQVRGDVERVIAVPLSADCFAIACRTIIVALNLRVLSTVIPFRASGDRRAGVRHRRQPPSALRSLVGGRSCPSSDATVP